MATFFLLIIISAVIISFSSYFYLTLMYIKQLEGPQLMKHGFNDAIAKVGMTKFITDLFWVGMFYHLYNQVDELSFYVIILYFLEKPWTAELFNINIQFHLVYPISNYKCCCRVIWEWFIPFQASAHITFSFYALSWQLTPSREWHP